MKSAAIFFTAVALLSVVIGRVETYDLTEGQALVHGWIYWAIAGAAGLLAVVTYR